MPVHTKRKLTPGRKAAFIEDLRRHGIFVQAARVASPHAKDRHGASSTFRDQARRDPVFAAAIISAQEQADAALLSEARRRAVEGVERGIFQKAGRVIDHDGKPASEKVYSDRLLELLLKSRFPSDFQDRRAIEHHHAPSGWQISSTDLHALSDIQTEQLQKIVATVMTARGEIEPDRAAIDDKRGEAIEAEFEEITDQDLEAEIPW